MYDRYNIIYFYIYNRYNQVVYCCALLEDFKQLPYQDLTEIGKNDYNYIYIKYYILYAFKKYHILYYLNLIYIII
jgi:hypothetical protein